MGQFIKSDKMNQMILKGFLLSSTRFWQRKSEDFLLNNVSQTGWTSCFESGSSRDYDGAAYLPSFSGG